MQVSPLAPPVPLSKWDYLRICSLMLDTVGPERMKNRIRYIHRITHPSLKKKPQMCPHAQHMDKPGDTPPTQQGWRDLTPHISCPISPELLDEVLKEKEPLDGTPMGQEGLVENGLCDD